MNISRHPRRPLENVCKKLCDRIHDLEHTNKRLMKEIESLEERNNSLTAVQSWNKQLTSMEHRVEQLEQESKQQRSTVRLSIKKFEGTQEVYIHIQETMDSAPQLAGRYLMSLAISEGRLLPTLSSQTAAEALSDILINVKRQSIGIIIVAKHCPISFFMEEPLRKLLYERHITLLRAWY